MKDTENLVKNFEDVTNILKEHLNYIEDLRDKDKTTTMAFVLQQKEMFKANITKYYSLFILCFCGFLCL